MPSTAAMSPARPTVPCPADARVRLARVLAATGLAVLAAVVLSTRFADAGSPAPAATGVGVSSAMVVVVQPGDTLWSVARSLQPSGDLRPLVARLSRANGGSGVRAGDRLSVPAELLGPVGATP
jgi:LysM repeat protein